MINHGKNSYSGQVDFCSAFFHNDAHESSEKAMPLPKE